MKIILFWYRFITACIRLEGNIFSLSVCSPGGWSLISDSFWKGKGVWCPVFGSASFPEGTGLPPPPPPASASSRSFPEGEEGRGGQERAEGGTLTRIGIPSTPFSPGQDWVTPIPNSPSQDWGTPSPHPTARTGYAASGTPLMVSRGSSVYLQTALNAVWEGKQSWLSYTSNHPCVDENFPPRRNVACNMQYNPWNFLSFGVYWFLNQDIARVKFKRNEWLCVCLTQTDDYFQTMGKKSSASVQTTSHSFRLNVNPSTPNICVQKKF